MNILIAILIFSVIIIIHEMGHFFLAKKNGIGVTEFSVGMGPRIITVVKTAERMSVKFFASTDDCLNRPDWKERTKYSLKLLPLGGSCMMLGEDETVDDDKAFGKKSVWARISVIFAGPFFNFVLAFILAMIIIACNGYDQPRITEVVAGSPMEDAGFQKGDLVTGINGTKIHFMREISMEFMFHPVSGKPVDITVERDGEKFTQTVKPRVNEEGGYKLGLGYSGNVYPNVRPDVLGTLKYSVYEVRFWIVNTVKSLGQLLQGKVKMDDMAGPVGIVNIIGDTYEESKTGGIGMVLLNMLNISLLLTANLGVMNLLPIPALDGGRLVFLFLEAIRGKPINQEKEAMVHMIGLFALMILMAVVMFNDVGRLIGR